jgi:cytidine deaminase
MGTRLDDTECEQLMEAAREASSRAFAPWSGLQVGAVLLAGSGETYRGCNVENSAFGLTMCAERVAVFSAVAEVGREKLDVRALAVVSADGSSCPPCGACRQVLAELAPDAFVIFRDQGGVRQVPVGELLPYGFRMSRE